MNARMIQKMKATKPPVGADASLDTNAERPHLLRLCGAPKSHPDSHPNPNSNSASNPMPFPTRPAHPGM